MDTRENADKVDTTVVCVIFTTISRTFVAQLKYISSPMIIVLLHKTIFYYYLLSGFLGRIIQIQQLFKILVTVYEMRKISIRLGVFHKKPTSQ